MKKLSIVCACLLAGSTLMAQVDLKDIERQLKSPGVNNGKVLSELQPVLNDPTEGKTMMPWYLAGKAAYGIHDDMVKTISLVGDESMSNADKAKSAHALIDGYKYMYKALSLDTIVDEKGKVKTKKSKDIAKEIAGNHNYLWNAGIYMIYGNDFDGAAEAFELYRTVPSDPRLGKTQLQPLTDSIVGWAKFTQAFALLCADETNPNPEKLQEAYKLLQEVDASPYENINTYAYLIQVCNKLNLEDARAEYAQKGYDRYGLENIIFVQALINDRMAKQDFDGALALVDDALSGVSPEDKAMQSQLYRIKGVIAMYQSKYADAIQPLTMAVELDPTNGNACNELGIAYNQLAVEKEDANDVGITPEIKEDLLNAAKYYEMAFNIDENQFAQAADSLYRIYYNLGKEYIEQAKLWESLK